MKSQKELTKQTETQEMLHRQVLNTERLCKIDKNLYIILFPGRWKHLQESFYLLFMANKGKEEKKNKSLFLVKIITSLIV